MVVRKRKRRKVNNDKKEAQEPLFYFLRIEKKLLFLQKINTNPKNART
jgi:hypothetical protein